MLIVEGSDRVGKSTFVKALTEHPVLRAAGYISAHFGRLPNGFDHYWGYIDRASRYIVQDRFHMSEIVYADARGENPMISVDQYWMLDGVLRQLGVFTVVITAEPVLIEERWTPTEMYKLGTIQVANKSFERIITQRWYGEYRPEFDYHIHCTRHRPFPDEHDVNRIVELYTSRQASLDVLNRRRLHR